MASPDQIETALRLWDEAGQQVRAMREDLRGDYLKRATIVATYLLRYTSLDALVDAYLSVPVDVAAALDEQSQRADGDWLNRGLLEDRAYLLRSNTLAHRDHEEGMEEGVENSEEDPHGVHDRDW